MASNLQLLFDYYTKKKPSKGKLDAAVKLLIHTCKALRISSAEEVGPDQFEEIPRAIEIFHAQSKDAAIQDKSILAEMIGSYGPRDGWDIVLDKLLNDNDKNLRQFALQTLELSGSQDPQIVIPYIEKAMISKDAIMVHIAAILVSRLYCSGHQDRITSLICEWEEQGKRESIQQVYTNIPSMERDPHTKSDCQMFKSWLKHEFLL